jgi:phage protein U
MIGSLTSGLLDNVKDIGIARVTALTPFIGYIGDLIFMSSQMSVRTFNNLTRKTTAQFAEHAVIRNKPVSEFTGMDLDEFSFEMLFYGGLGVEPLTEFDSLQKMANSGKAQPIFLHGKKQGNFTIRGLEGNETHWHLNRPIVMVVSLSLKEFVDSISVAAEMKLREDELRRGSTGIGGPERLQGAAEPTQTRNLTPKIDSVTRMVVR